VGKLCKKSVKGEQKFFSVGGKSTRNRGGAKGLSLRRRETFLVGGSNQENLSQRAVSLFVLHAAQDGLNRVRNKDLEALAEDLKNINQGESHKGTKVALRSLQVAFLPHPKPVRRYLCTPNPLERLAKEVNRQRVCLRSYRRKCHPPSPSPSPRGGGKRPRFSETSPQTD